MAIRQICDTWLPYKIWLLAATKRFTTAECFQLSKWPTFLALLEVRPISKVNFRELERVFLAGQMPFLSSNQHYQSTTTIHLTRYFSNQLLHHCQSHLHTYCNSSRQQLETWTRRQYSSSAWYTRWMLDASATLMRPSPLTPKPNQFIFVPRCTNNKRSAKIHQQILEISRTHNSLGRTDRSVQNIHV